MWLTHRCCSKRMDDELLKRIRRFRTDYFPQYQGQFKALVEQGQHPTILFVGCSDSRLLPYMLTGAGPGELFIVATPIGNLSDITHRAVETLRSVDAVICEDTRHSGKLLSHLAISKPCWTQVSTRPLANC